MTQSLQKAAVDYFAAKNRHDIEGMLANFHEEAFVTDEGERKLGLQLIRQWMEETTKRYRVNVEIRGFTGDDKRTEVEGLVSGDFPGSPATLTYIFSFKNGKIASLGIE